MLPTVSVFPVLASPSPLPPTAWAAGSRPAARLNASTKASNRFFMVISPFIGPALVRLPDGSDVRIPTIYWGGQADSPSEDCPAPHLGSRFLTIIFVFYFSSILSIKQDAFSIKFLLFLPICTYLPCFCLINPILWFLTHSLLQSEVPETKRMMSLARYYFPWQLHRDHPSQSAPAQGFGNTHAVRSQYYGGQRIWHLCVGQGQSKQTISEWVASHIAHHSLS